jgi:hypothetical protein
MCAVGLDRESMNRMVGSAHLLQRFSGFFSGCRYRVLRTGHYLVYGVYIRMTSRSIMKRG